MTFFFLSGIRDILIQYVYNSDWHKKSMANKIIKTMSVLLVFPISYFNVILSIMKFN